MRLGSIMIYDIANIIFPFVRNFLIIPGIVNGRESDGVRKYISPLIVSLITRRRRRWNTGTRRGLEMKKCPHALKIVDGLQLHRFEYLN